MSIKLQGVAMSKGVLSTTSDIVNGIWGVGTEIYRTVADEVSDAVADEAMSRTRQHFKDKGLDENGELFVRHFSHQKKVVEKEFKGMAIKGGLMAMGFGLFF